MSPVILVDPVSQDRLIHLSPERGTIMLFDDLVQHIMALTGLTLIQATRLLTGQIYMLTDNLVTATSEEMINADMAEQIMVLTALSVADMAQSIK